MFPVANSSRPTRDIVSLQPLSRALDFFCKLPTVPYLLFREYLHKGSSQFLVEPPLSTEEE